MDEQPLEFAQLSRALSRVDEGKLKAFADHDRVLIMIQDAPEELRRMAAALEKLNVREIQALIAYKNPSLPPEERPAPARSAGREGGEGE